MKSLTQIILLSFLVLSSSAQVKTNFTQQDYSKFFIDDCIPKDLKSDGHILLVRTPFKEDEQKENDEIKQIFETYYKDKFVVVPVESKDFDNGAYTDAKLYKYSISMLATYTNDGLHKHYELSIIDRSKMGKNILSPKAVRDSIIKITGHKKPTLEDYKKYDGMADFDKTAIHKTGLEDAHGKLNSMLTFLAEKLGNFK